MTSAPLFGLLILERDPYTFGNFLGLFQAWLQDAGGFAALGLVVYLVYARFINTVTQLPTVVQLLPVEPPTEQEGARRNVDYIYEPDAASIFEALLPRYIDVQVYQALLETLASFFSAQMVAMKNATDNANDLIQDLTLTYNKARQASITTQILEVVSGAAAL